MLVLQLHIKYRKFVFLLKFNCVNICIKTRYLFPRSYTYSLSKASKRASIIYPNRRASAWRLFIHVGMSSETLYRPITLPHASPFRQGERQTREERREEPPESKGRKKKKGGEHIPVPRASTHMHVYAYKNATPHAYMRARISPTQTPLSTRPVQERVRPYTCTHARMQTHAPFGEDKTGRMERGRVGGWE